MGFHGAVLLLDEVADQRVVAGFELEGAVAGLARRERFDLADERAVGQRGFVERAVGVGRQIVRRDALDDYEFVGFRSPAFSTAK